MNPNTPIPGQRWASDSEPELGLGIILAVTSGRVEVFFPAANEHRQYAMESAPLRRVLFADRDTIKTHAGESLPVDSVEFVAELAVYQCGPRSIPEAELSDLIGFQKAEERLLGGQMDSLSDFNLRVEALHWRTRIRQSSVRGYVGGRVDLIPHQLSIAADVASRLMPRVLLADEVGLGKTIEAGLILHRLHLTGRAERILILLPEPLVHQWFVEMLRRFNLLFSVFDEERCAAIEEHNPDANPFTDSQLVICAVSFASGNPVRSAQILEAGWDLLIVDEAHHLEWTPQSEGPEYQLVEAASAKIEGLLLLTATPQRLGEEGHFARLRLLDPDRYPELERYQKESAHFGEVAKVINTLLEGGVLSGKDLAAFRKKSQGIHALCQSLEQAESEEQKESLRAEIASELLDEFGTGRVLYRNSRAMLKGFPKRKLELVALSGDDSKIESRMEWLEAFLKKTGRKKVLLICHSKELAEKVVEELRGRIRVACALFHEGLSLMQRDRNAAFFAEEEGARLLVCSEIGSEGRNFQFAQHLVLFDLPEDPELLEQRIGRLDRIGQKGIIHIHVPYIQGTSSEVLARWFHEGLDAFEHSLHGAAEIVKPLRPDLKGLLSKYSATKLSKFIRDTSKTRRAVAEKLGQGEDRLLALHSSRPGASREIAAAIRKADADEKFEEFFLRLLDFFGVDVEDLSSRSYLLKPGVGLKSALPGLPEEGMSVTFDRARALSREDMGFVTIDHPLVRGALDTLLGAESGNTAFGIWKTSGKESILLEVHAVVECVAPSALHCDDFLPPTPLRVVVDHACIDQSGDPDFLNATLTTGDVFRLLDKPVVKKKIFPAMLAKATEIATGQMERMTLEAATTMQRILQHEIDRMEDLAAQNGHIRACEIEKIRSRKKELLEAIRSARLRTDTLRFVMKSP